MNNNYLPKALIEYWDNSTEYGYDELQEKLRTAYALNLCTVSVSRIIDNRDQYIMDQEYDAILNNLNLQNMPDSEALLKILKEILDVITFFRIQEGDRKFIEEDYKAELKQNLSKAVNVAGLLGSISSIGISNLTNPIGWVKAGISVASTVGIGYMNYQSGKSQARLKKRKQDWELQRSAIEQLNGLRRELFDTAWRITKDFDLEDEFRLTEIQIEQYLDILKDEDDFKRFERLDFIKKKFYAYPPFWYQLGHTAKLVALQHRKNEDYYIKYAMACFEFFNGQVAINLLRDDEIASSCALEYTELLDPVKDKKKIVLLLDQAVRFSGNKNDVLQMCAVGYMRVGELNTAARLFWRLVNEQYEENYNAEMLSLIYYQLYISVKRGEDITSLLVPDDVDSNYCLIPIDALRKADVEERLDAISYIYDILRRRTTEDAYLIPLPSETNAISENGYLLKRAELLKLKVNNIVSQADYKYIKRFIGIIVSDKYENINDEITTETNIDEWIKTKIEEISVRTGANNYISSLSNEPFRIQVYEVLNELFGCIGKLTQQDHEVENQVEDIINTYVESINEKIIQYEEIFEGKNNNTDINKIKSEADLFNLSGLLEMINPIIQSYYYNQIDNVSDISEISDLEHQLYVFTKEFDLEVPIIPYIEEYNDSSPVRETIPFTLDPDIFGIPDLNLYKNQRRLEKEKIEAIISKLNEHKDKVVVEPDRCEFRISGDDSYEAYILGRSKFNHKIPLGIIYNKGKLLQHDITLAFDNQGVHWIEKGVGVNYLDIDFGEKNKLILSDNHKVNVKGANMDEFRSMIESIQPIVTDRNISERKYLNEDWIESKALKIVNRFTVLAAMNGGNPIPMANIAPQLSLQVSMMYAIANTFKIHVSKEQLKDLAKEVISKSSSNVAKQQAIKALVNLVPGGMLVGSAVSASSAGALTHATGVSFVEYCKELVSNHDGVVDEKEFVRKASSSMQKKFDEIIDIKEKEICEKQNQKAIESHWNAEELNFYIEDAEKSVNQAIHNMKVSNKIITEENQKTSEQIRVGWDSIHAQEEELYNKTKSTEDE